MASSSEPLSSEHIKVSAPESDLNMGKDVSPREDRNSVFDEMEDDKPTLNFMGRDLAQIPCFKDASRLPKRRWRWILMVMLLLLTRT